ncbi:putative transcriptional regulatory protein C15D4.02 [Fusarium oxysporum f. sp. albedinis]|nr:putative transcriptional regulatory protein C15D4.02 [Fusarium oxysporum f. sp. albedinis]
MPSMSCFNWFASALRPVSRIFRIFFHERHPTAIDHYPPTPEQLHSQKQAFIDSIDHDALEDERAFNAKWLVPARMRTPTILQGSSMAARIFLI